MHKAVFLDRDGVINEDRGQYTFRKEDFRWIGGVTDAIRMLRRRNYLVIVISNQAGIARGACTHAEVETLHRYMLETARAQGADLTEIYYCPHYTELGRCLCRKPDSLLIEKALARFGIDPAVSFFVGDQPRDLQAAAKAGVRGLPVETNAGLGSILPLIP
jgi:D-glycero-D-manno-heptose 1,7-bisphosphate phosphatase